MPKAKISIAASTTGMATMMKSMAKATTRRASTPSNNSGLRHRVVGVGFDVDRHAAGPYCFGRKTRAPSPTEMEKESAARKGAPAGGGTGRLERGASLRHGGFKPRRADAVSISLTDIEAARRVIAGAVLRTPILPAPRLSALTGAQVYVKYENLQVTNSFKDRGALVKLASLSEAERKRGVIAMSAGNHAQAVAYHAARLGIPATIVMPVTTPFVKVAATRSHGAEVVLDGETVAEAQARCERSGASAG